MSLIERGQAELEQLRVDQRLRDEQDWRDCYGRTVFFYRLAFLRRRDPIPTLERFERLAPGSSVHIPARFSIDGLTFETEWEYSRAGSDRADWDDGWWPTFYLVMLRPRRWLPFLEQRQRERVWGVAAIARALTEGRLA